MIENVIELIGEIDIGSGGGITDYDLLLNKPMINDIELSGNKTFENLGMTEISNTELDAMFKDL